MKYLLAALLLAGCGGSVGKDPPLVQQSFNVLISNNLHVDARCEIQVEPGNIRFETAPIGSGGATSVDLGFVPQKVVLYLHSDGGTQLYGPIYGPSPPFDSPPLTFYYGTDFNQFGLGITADFK